MHYLARNRGFLVYLLSVILLIFPKEHPNVPQIPILMKILLAEDDNLIRKTIEIRLVKDGYDIISCSEGTTALENLKTNLPDIVITDIMLPSASGLEIVSAVRDMAGKTIKVIVLSAMGQEDIVEEAFKLGADDYMTKPFSLTELSIRVKKLAGK